MWLCHYYSCIVINQLPMVAVVGNRSVLIFKGGPSPGAFTRSVTIKDSILSIRYVTNIALLTDEHSPVVESAALP